MTTLLEKTLSAIDDVNREDSNQTLVGGIAQAKELVYGQRMTECLLQHWPNSDELLQIAVRGQHIKRWHLKRSDFEQGKAGYYQWRTALGTFHAELTASLMVECGYSAVQAKQTASIICKENLKNKAAGEAGVQLNADSQTLEDVACLVFLQHYFDDFAAKITQMNNEAKIIRIVQRTWGKMSERGHELALQLELPQHLAQLIKKALAS